VKVLAPHYLRTDTKYAVGNLPPDQNRIPASHLKKVFGPDIIPPEADKCHKNRMSGIPVIRE
jgi:hypothetical protein